MKTGAPGYEREAHGTPWQVLHHHAFRVGTNTDQARSVGFQYIHRQLVVRVFDDHTVTVVQEDARNQCYRLLRAADDQNVGGSPGRTSAAAQIVAATRRSGMKPPAVIMSARHAAPRRRACVAMS